MFAGDVMVHWLDGVVEFRDFRPFDGSQFCNSRNFGEFRLPGQRTGRESLVRQTGGLLG